MKMEANETYANVTWRQGGMMEGEYIGVAHGTFRPRPTRHPCPFCLRPLGRVPSRVKGDRIVRVLAAPCAGVQRVLVQRVPDKYMLLMCMPCRQVFTLPRNVSRGARFL